MDFEIISNKLNIRLDKSIYNEDVLHKCFYWYGGNYSVSISSFSESEFKVLITPKTEGIQLETIIDKIQQDLIDFKLRDIVTKETQTIRELIVAKAFAYYELEENPTTEVSDPVGFDPNNIKEHTNTTVHD